MILADELIPLSTNVDFPLETLRRFHGRTLARADILDCGATALFVRSTTRVNKDLLAGTNVKFVGSATAGIDHIDVDYLARNGIGFAHAPASNAWAVAEYTLAWISILAPDPGSLVCLVGHGNVGVRVEAALRELGYRIRIYDPPLYGESVGTLTDIVEAADVLTLHVPFTHDTAYPTAGMLSDRLLRSMKPGSLLINTARGGIVDDDALATLCRNQRIRAVLDVFQTEPDLPMSVVESVRYCTPHIAGYSIQAKLGAASALVKAYSEWNQHGTATIPPVGRIVQPVGAGCVGTNISRLRTVQAESEYFFGRYSEQPDRKTFDELRQQYKLCNEVLSTCFVVKT